MTITLEQIQVPGSGTLIVHATVHNGRTSPVLYSVGRSLEMRASLPLPLEPVGKKWSGIEADFKARALGAGNENGETQTISQHRMYADSYKPGSAVAAVQLLPGETVHDTFTWQPSLDFGLPAYPGKAELTVLFAHDPLITTPGPDMPIITEPPYLYLAATANFQLTGTAPKLLSEGQIVDRVLSDRDFDTWLRERPKTSWTGVNLVIGAGPRWEIDLFREEAGRAAFVIAYVDPYSGAVKLDFCRAPCTRTD